MLGEVVFLSTAILHLGVLVVRMEMITTLEHLAPPVTEALIGRPATSSVNSG